MLHTLLEAGSALKNIFFGGSSFGFVTSFSFDLLFEKSSVPFFARGFVVAAAFVSAGLVSFEGGSSFFANILSFFVIASFGGADEAFSGTRALPLPFTSGLARLALSLTALPIYEHGA